MTRGLKNYYPHLTKRLSQSLSNLLSPSQASATANLDHGWRIWPVRPVVLLVAQCLRHPLSTARRLLRARSVPGPRIASVLRKLRAHGGAVMTAAELGSSHHGPFRAPSARAEAGRDRSHTVGSAVKEGLSEVVTPMLSQSCPLPATASQGKSPVPP